MEYASSGRGLTGLEHKQQSPAVMIATLAIVILVLMIAAMQALTTIAATQTGYTLLQVSQAYAVATRSMGHVTSLPMLHAVRRSQSHQSHQSHQPTIGQHLQPKLICRMTLGVLTSKRCMASCHRRLHTPTPLASIGLSTTSLLLNPKFRIFLHPLADVHRATQRRVHVTRRTTSIRQLMFLGLGILIHTLPSLQTHGWK